MYLKYDVRFEVDNFSTTCRFVSQMRVVLRSGMVRARNVPKMNNYIVCDASVGFGTWHAKRDENRKKKSGRQQSRAQPFFETMFDAHCRVGDEGGLDKTHDNNHNNGFGGAS